MRYVALLAVLMLLVAGCISPPPASNNSKPAVITNASVVQPTVTNPTIAQMGDHVWVNYTLRVDGKVYDTNNATLANESGIYNPNRQYVPLDFNLELNKGIIDGFVLDIIGMEVGETLTFDVDPKRGYGEYDPKKVTYIPRYYEKNLSEVVPRSYFTERNITVEKGSSFDSKYGTIFVEELNDENVTIHYMVMPGQSVMVNGLPQSVVNVTNGSATMEFALDVNKTYNLPDPNTGAPGYYKVLGKTDQNITLDGNHPLANKTLTFKVTLLNITRPS